METVNSTNVDQAVKQLKAKGYRLSVVHWRRVAMGYKFPTLGNVNVAIPVDMPLFEIRRRNLNSDILAKGGYTTMRLTHKEKNIEVVGESRCHPNDSFNNKLAYTKSFFNILSSAKEAGINLE